MGLINSDLCSCGEVQTMNHIVDCCPLTRLEGGLLRLHTVDDSARDRLKSFGTVEHTSTTTDVSLGSDISDVRYPVSESADHYSWVTVS